MTRELELSYEIDRLREQLHFCVEKNKSLGAKVDALTQERDGLVSQVAVLSKGERDAELDQSALEWQLAQRECRELKAERDKLVAALKDAKLALAIAWDHTPSYRLRESLREAYDRATEALPPEAK